MGKKQDNNQDKKQEIETLTLEQTFDCLTEAIEQLEDPDISLEDSFAVYEHGMKLLKACHDKIDAVEKKVLQINKAGELDEF